MKYRTFEDEENDQSQENPQQVADLADIMTMIHANDSIIGVRIA